MPKSPFTPTKLRSSGARLSLSAACVLLAALALSQTLMPAGSAEARRAPSAGQGGESARLSEGYGKLPLRFEANRGQAGGAVKFLARGSGYTLFLAEAGAVLRLSAAGGGGEVKRSGALRLTLEGSNRRPPVSGLGELPGRSNYLVGADARAWRTGVPAFEKVRYESVYKGIDAVYYGRQGRLEYDFVVAPGADPSRIRLRFDGARETRLEENGDLVISVEGGDVRQQRPVAYQEFDGARREVKAGYALDARGRVRFELGEYDRGRALVIDPVLLYSSYLGGAADDTGTSVAVDASGSAYVAGTTTSADFPGPGSLQAAKGDFNDAFVLKLSPDGKSLVYATYLGGNGDDLGNAVAVDSAGSAYVGGLTGSGNFPTTPGSFQTSKDGSADAFLAKLNPAGTALVYSTYIGGKGGEQVTSVAVDAAGAAYAAGRTDSVNFTNVPTANRAGSPVYRSTDGGASWGASGSGLTATSVNDFAVAPNVVYAAANLGVYRSTDGGASWQLGGQASPSTSPILARAVVVDPSNPSVVYAGTGGFGSGVYKSTDGGLTFAAKGSGIFVPVINALAVNPAAPDTLYAGTPVGVFKTTNGGDTWAEANGPNFGSTPSINKLVIDPSNPQTVYAATTSRGVLKTTDGGASWAQVNNGLAQFSFPPQIRALALDPSNPSTLYASMGTPPGGIFKTTDGGASWVSSSAGLTATNNGQTITPISNAILVDPASPSVVYAATSGFGVYRSTDGGASWAPTNTGLANRTVLALASRPGSPAAVLAGVVTGADPFVLKLNPAGTLPEYLRLLGGSENDDARSVALGPGGSAYVVGTTASTDFPVANARQPALAGGASNDAYVVKLDAGGNTVYSTYHGGSFADQGAGVAVGADGSAYVVGVTFSTDFPVANAFKPALGENNQLDAFVTKLSPDGQTLAYSTYLGGTGSDVGTSVAVDSSGSAYVAGQTGSADFPLAGAANPFAGFTDAFVTKLNPAGSALLYSTCFGGSGGPSGFDNEQANAVALDGAGGIYIAGTTTSTNLPLTNAARGTFGGGRTDAFVAKFGPGIDLAVTLTDSPDPVAFGADLTYSVKVRNNGDLTATGVRLTDVLPAGATLVSAAADRGSCSGSATVVCDVGALGGGEEANVSIKVRPPAVRTINNTVTATLNESDANNANNSASAETTVDFADLAVTKSALNGTVAPGAKAVFLLTVTNKSGADAASVTLSDALPAGLTFASCDAPGGVCGGTGNSRTVTFTSLAVGATASASIAATVDASAAAGTVLNNNATASSSLPDNDPSNNGATASVTAGPTVVTPRSNGKILFSTGDGIYTVNADGTGRTKIRDKAANSDEFFPVWSPDGTKIAFQREERGLGFTRLKFYVMDADGSNLHRVGGDTTVRARATWSPDGSHLAFIGSDVGVYAVGADGTGLARVAPNPGFMLSPGFVHGLDWSPDGTRFVFEKDTRGISVMDVDGSNQRKLTESVQTSDGLTRDSHPLWSPDGARVTFTRSTTNGVDAYVVNADGTGLRRLLNIQQIARPHISPDGTKAVYVRYDGMYVSNLDGSGLPVPLGGGSDPLWQPLPNANPTPTPTPVPTFTISGRVTKPDGTAGSATVRLSGTRAATIGTDGNGNYSFFDLPKGGTYTVTPERGTLGLFNVYTPGSRTVSDLQADATGLDFRQTSVQHVIRGRVTDTAGNGLGGVRVVLTRGGQVETTTDAQGNYSFNTFFGGDFYAVQPSLSGFAFDPVRAALPTVTGDVTVNFVGAPFQGVRALQGRIIDTSGNGIAGLPVTLSGARNAVVKTDAGGGYVFYNLPAGQNYTVTPSTADGLGFTPAQRSYPNLNAGGFDGFVATSALPTVQFAATDVSVAENARVVELTLTRGPDPQLAAYVDFETSDLTGSERSDYIAAFGTVRFNPGETSQKVRVLVTDDNLSEGERAFKVTLKGARNAFVGAAREATVRITEDDAEGSAANPLDSSEFFVAQHYADFLNRAPDASGLAFWVNEIEQCGADAQCREVKRINVSAAFFLSIEFQETGFLAYKTHKAAFGTGEALPHKTFLKDTQEIGRGVVVGLGEWRAQLDANKQAYLNDFVLRPEFQFAYPLTLAPSVFVDTLNANTGGSLSQAERDTLVAGLTSGELSRAAVLRAVVESAEFSRRETNRAFVLTQYYGYLRRAPNDPPDADFVGYNFWLGKLNEFNGNYIAAEMVKAFISSDEYRTRF
ncbi:MAG TPA: SBBP repeat-containing protein [Pyrinomonadaceae bacterium]